MSGIAFLRNLLKKEAMKKSKDASGIMTLNKQLIDDVDNTVKKWVDSAKRQGQDIDKMGEEEIKYIVELNKPKGPMIGEHRVIDATSSEGQGITDQLTKQLERLKPKKAGEVVDITGKKIDTSKHIMGGKNVPEDIVTDTVITMKKMTPIDAMKEANLVIGRKGKYKNLTIDESQDILKKTNDHIFERDIKYDEFGEIIKPDPEDLAHGGRTGTGLNYLLGEDDQNMRVPFGKGKLADVGRRLFLQAMGVGAATAGAAKTGLLGLLKGGGKKEVVKELTSVPINNISGMPAWFKPLVNRVIKEGDDVSKRFATQERQIVHKTELPDSKTDVMVTQDLNTGNVSVEIGLEKHGFSEGHLGQPVRLEYKASEVIEPPIVKEGKVAGHGEGVKTKEEFWVEEAEFTGGHPENVKFEESSFNKFGEHGSDFSEVEEFATGLKKGKGGSGHMACGGRVPLAEGSSPMHGNYSVDEILEFKKQLKNNGYSPGEANDYVRWLLRKNKMLEFPSVGFSSGGLAGMLGE